MTEVSEASTLKIAAWAREFERGTISGSIYAVPPVQRLEAAKVLAGEGHRVHIDFIIAPDGEAIGVTPEELLLISRALPGSQFDAHLILLGTEMTEAVRKAAEAAIRAVHQVQAQTLALSPQALEDFADLLPGLRESNVTIWAEIPVGMEPPDLDRAEGALVMLIEAGTKNAADRSQLKKVSDLAPTTVVGIDGGVTASVAAEGRVAGAKVIVSGRALFEVTK
jgi:hypothetical protein